MELLLKGSYKLCVLSRQRFHARIPWSGNSTMTIAAITERANLDSETGTIAQMVVAGAPYPL